MSLGLLMLLEMRFLSEENSARCALERPDSFVDALVHIAVRGRREDLQDLSANLLLYTLTHIVFD